MKPVRAARHYRGSKLSDTDKVVYNSLVSYAFRIGKPGMDKYNCAAGWYTKPGNGQVAASCGKSVDEATEALKRLEELDLIHVIRADGDFSDPIKCPLVALQVAKIKKSDVRKGAPRELVLEDGGWSAAVAQDTVEQHTSTGSAASLPFPSLPILPVLLWFTESGWCKYPASISSVRES